MSNLIILGFSGSGKSIVQKFILNSTFSISVPEYIVPPFIPQVFQSISDPVIRDSFCNGIAANIKDYSEGVAVTARVQKVANSIRYGSGVIDRVRRALNKENDFLIYESNFMSFAPELITSSLQPARVIILMRNGLDCAHEICMRYKVLTNERLTSINSQASIFCDRKEGDLNIPWWVKPGEEDSFTGYSSFVRAMLMWQAMALRLGQFLEKQEPSDVLLLKFEDMICDPEVTFGTINDFLSVPSHRAAMKEILKLTAGCRSKVGLHRERSDDEVHLARTVGRSGLEHFGYIESFSK